MRKRNDSANDRAIRSNFLNVAIYTDIREFKFGDVSETGKHTFFLEISPAGSGEQIGIPLLIANGAKSGKTLVVLAGVHGDELEGVQAIHDVFNQLETNEMSGRFVAVPTANLPAVRVVKRNSPHDLLNLARVFPGNKAGTVTERIAFYLSELVIPQADLFLDLHSSGVAALMPLMVGYDATTTDLGKASREAALRFGAPVIWGHEEVGPGRSISSAIEQRIPWLYVESPNGGRVSFVDLPYYVGGIFNLLKYLEIIPGEIAPSAPEYRLIGSGDVDRTQSVATSGFFIQKVKLMDFVERGQLIGIVRNLFGEAIEEIRTGQAGYVAMLRATPLVEPGISVCLVAESEPDN
jgi:predicted deacylase